MRERFVTLSPMTNDSTSLRSLVTPVLGLAAALAVFASRPAHADGDPLPRGYVSLAGEVGFHVGFNDGAALGGAYRVQELPLYIHAQLDEVRFGDVSAEAIGGSSSDQFYQGSGTFLQVRAGAEYLHCSSGGTVCGVYGTDLGVMRSGWTKTDTFDHLPFRYTEEELIPRLAVDVGSRRLRVRATADLAVGLTQRDHMATAGTSSSAGFQGYSLGAALVVRL